MQSRKSSNLLSANSNIHPITYADSHAYAKAYLHAGTQPYPDSRTEIDYRSSCYSLGISGEVFSNPSYF